MFLVGIVFVLALLRFVFVEKTNESYFFLIGILVVLSIQLVRLRQRKNKEMKKALTIIHQIEQGELG